MFRTTFLTILLVGCGGGELPGQYFAVEAEGTENLCTGDELVKEQFEYRLVIEGNDLQVAIEEDIFATGTIEGCSLSYTSLVWSDYREGKEIQWQIVGSADANLGGGAGCVEGTDWQGTETFIIVTSAHEGVQPGCTYTSELTGSFLREVGGEGEDAADPVE